MSAVEEIETTYGVTLYRSTERPAAGNPVVLIRDVLRARLDLPEVVTLDPDDESQWVRGGRRCWIWCPGCDMAHAPAVVGSDGSQPDGPCWEWNGRDDDQFGIEPSLLVQGWSGGASVCHSFIRNGRWEFLGDSTHQLAGRTVPMVPLPDWLVRERS
jgi:hypothetical protein